MAQNKHKTKRRIICILFASIIALYALAIPIGAVVNSSQVPEGSTALYGQSTFPYSVGFVCSDENLDRNYIFATEIGTYGLNNNQTIFGEDQFEWHYPDSTDTETTLIEYSGVDQMYLRDSLRWYANRSIEYGSNYGYTYGGFGQMNLEYYTNTQDFVDNVESIIFKASDVYYNTIWLTHQESITTFSYLDNPTPIEFMMPTVMLPTLDDYTTKAFVGAFSVECSILDDRGNTHNISYSVPIDTRVKVPLIPFIEYNALKDFIKLNNGVVDDTTSCKTLLITEYRGYLDVDYYEYTEPEPIDELAGTWVLNNVIKPYNESFTPIDTSWLQSGNFSSGLGTFSAYDGSTVVSNDIFNFMIYTVSGASDNIAIFNINSNPSSYPYVNYTRNKADIYLGSGSSNHKLVARSDYDGQYTITFNDNVNSISTEKYSLIYDWFNANCTKQTSVVTVVDEGTWELVPDSREYNKVSVTFPIYDTSNSQGIPPYASTLFAYPSATKFVQSYEANIDINPTYPTYDEIPEDMYQDYSGWLGRGVAGFFQTQIFPGLTLGGIVGVMVMFGCAIALLKIFAGG